MIGPAIRRLFVVAGTFASIVALVISLDPTPDDWRAFEIALAVLASVGFLVVGIIEVRDVLRRTPRPYSDRNKIWAYLYEWIREGDRVVVFTRDMSWADEDEMIQLLKSKAYANELTVCLPERTSLIEDLSEAGAEVITYPDLDFVPSSRFTIVRYERADAEVAIGRTIDGVHVIEEFRVGEHPAYALADDLVRLTRQISGSS